MLIDFHCHTLAAKSGDAATRTVNCNVFREKINKANIGVVCITNHNIFDIENYDRLKESVKDLGVLVLPGIELDVLGIAPSHRKFHATIIFNDEEIKDTYNNLETILKNAAPDEISVSIDDYVRICNAQKCITAIHYFKSPSPDEETIHYIKNALNEEALFFYEPSNYRSLDILVNNSHKSIIGSDIKDWNEYERSTFTETKITIKDFDGLYNLFSRDKQVIETFLSGLDSFDVNISPNNREDYIKIYRGTNIIFGNKATGKTKALEIIKDYFDDKKMDISYYNQDEIPNEVNKKLEVKKEEKGLKLYSGNSCRNDFETLFNYDDNIPPIIEDYRKYEETKYINQSKARLKIINNRAATNSEYGKNLKKINDNLNTLKQIQNNFDDIDDKYIEDRFRIESILNNIKDRIIQDYANAVRNEIANRLSIHIQRIIGELAEKKTSTKNQPTTTGFKNVASAFFASCAAISNISKNIDFHYIGTEEHIANLETNKRLNKRLEVRMVTNSSKSEDGFENIMKLKKIRKEIDNMIRDCGTRNLSNSINTFNKDNEINKTNFSLETLTAYKRVFVVNSTEYKLSKGEETMIVLSEKCSSQHDVYILDEPEKSLGNSYVSQVLIPRLKTLDKLNKIIIIATHNANIAVGTAPLTSILKTYDGYSYETYVGNSYSNTLTNIHKSSDVKDWKNETMNILEGGAEAFDERREIYGRN